MKERKKERKTKDTEESYERGRKDMKGSCQRESHRDRQTER